MVLISQRIDTVSKINKYLDKSSLTTFFILGKLGGEKYRKYNIERKNKFYE